MKRHKLTLVVGAASNMRWGTLWRHPSLWLGIMVIVYCSVSIYTAVATFDNFSYVNANAANNVGIITQAVASTAYGQHAPFYESWDCLHTARCSFLLIHTSFILYLAAPVYNAAPSALTLFALQSVALGLAAVPLYWLTRQVTRSSGKGLFAAGLYLVWAPGFVNFTLHLETLLPVELIGLAALWQAGRFKLGLVVALVAFLTFEIAPIFVFLIGVFFLLEYAPVVARLVRSKLTPTLKLGPAPLGDEKSADPRTSLRALFQSPRVRATLILIVVSVIATVVLFSFRNVWGFDALGVSRPSSPPGLGGFFYDGGATTAGSVSSGITSAQTAQLVAEYWLILLGLVAFLPLLAPRSLVVIVPWLGYTFIVHGHSFFTVGLEETSIASAPIFIGVAYGLRRVPWPPGRRGDRQSGSDKEVADENAQALPRRSSRSRGVIKVLVVTSLALVVGANVVLSPIDPVLSAANYQPAGPFNSGYFNHPLSISQGVRSAENLVGLIPRHATIAANSFLFPLVASYPYAVVFVSNDPRQPFVDPALWASLPFKVPKGPEFVLVQSSYLAGSNLRPKFAQNLSNSSEYGLRGYVSSTAIGPLMLYEQGYTSVAQRFGPELTALNRSFAPGTGLVAGPKGKEVTNASAPGGVEIRSVQKTNSTGEVWTGPAVFLPSGTYTIRLEVSVTGANLSGTSQAVLRIVGTGFGTTVLNQTFPASTFTPGAWTSISSRFTAANPVPLFDVEGFLLDSGVSLGVATVSVTPAVAA